MRRVLVELRQLDFDPSKIDPDIVASLSALAKLMRSAEDDWFLIGGAAFILHGLEANTLSDIDVVASIADIDRLATILGIEAEPISSTPQFRSRRFLAWRGLPIKVEFMAGFEVKSGGVWVPIDAEQFTQVSVGGNPLYVPIAEAFVRICKLFGRPKDLQRLSVLRELKMRK